MLARVLLAQDYPRPALALLDRLHAPAADLGRTGSVIEIQALQALALAADGDQAAAVDRLAEALALGCPQGYGRMFADEGARPTAPRPSPARGSSAYSPDAPPRTIPALLRARGWA